MCARAFPLVFPLSLAIWLAGCSGPIKRLPTGNPSFPEFIVLQPALLEPRQIILEWPEVIRVDDPSRITLLITSNNKAQGLALTQAAAPIPDIYDTHNVVARARLEIAGVAADQGTFRQPILPGKEVAFRWNIRADTAGLYRGIVWLHLEFVPKGGGASHEVLLMARNIEIRSEMVFGMPASTARVFGLSALAASAALGVPVIRQRLAARRKRGMPEAAQER